MKLTTNETAVIRAYKEDCFVADYGWENEEAAAWIDEFHEDCGLVAKTFSGVMSSLVQKGIIVTNGESFSLTKRGIEIAGELK